MDNISEKNETEHTQEQQNRAEENLNADEQLENEAEHVHSDEEHLHSNYMFALKIVAVLLAIIIVIIILKASGVPIAIKDWLTEFTVSLSTAAGTNLSY